MRIFMKDKKEKKKIRGNTIGIIVCIVTLVVLLTVLAVMAVNLLKSMRSEEQGGVQILEELKDYGYQLTENNTEYFKELYYQLKNLLNGDKSDTFEEDYAKLVAQLFIADFYDLNSKLDKTDVGGVQFVWEDSREVFKNFASDPNGIYYYIENNIDGERTQALPSVSEVVIDSIEKEAYEGKVTKDEDAYKIQVTIVYEEKLGYDEKRTLILAHHGSKLEVVELN